MRTETLTVRFEGDGSGVAELSWGQREIWSVMQAQGSSLSFGGARPLPPGQTAGDIAAGLCFVMSRHQSLRTTLRFGPDDQIRQVVHTRGEITLEVVDAGEADPGEVADAVVARYLATNFDYEHEWPLRMAVVTQQGWATHVVEILCHLAVDAFGLAALRDDFDHREERTGPVTALQPLEQARRQHGPGGRRVHEASMRYFERQASSVPDRQFSPSAEPRSPRFWQLTFESRSGHLAARMLATRLGVSTSPVLLAAYAMALAPLISGPRVALHLVVSNRFRPGFADSVSPVMQTCLCVLEVVGVPFENVVGQAWRSALGAYKNAYYDPEGKRELCERLAAERGIADLDWHVIFNDRRVVSRDDAGPADGGGGLRLRDELCRTTLTWGNRNDLPAQTVFLSICDVPDILCCELRADTHVVSPADMAGLMHRIESVLVDAALSGGATSDRADGDRAGSDGQAAATGIVR